MDELRDIGCWVADHLAVLAELLFAGVVAWTAVVGLRLNRRLADAELDPAITVYLEPDQLHWTLFDLVIRNAGRGTARNVRFTVEPDIPVDTDDQDSLLTRMAIFRRGINFMAPLQEIRTFYGSYVQLEKEPITVHVAYDRDTPHRRGRTIRASFVLDVTEFEGLVTVGDPPELLVTKALGQIADDLNKIRQGGSGSNMTVTVKRRYFFSRFVNRRWQHFTQRWRNFRIRWANGEHPWRHRWDRLRHPIGKDHRDRG